MKKIKEIQGKRELEEEEKLPIYDKNNMLPPRDQPAIYDELPYDEPSPEKYQAQQTASCMIGGDMEDDLKYGEYDEERMRREFREALNNWRGFEAIDEQAEYPNEEEGCGVDTNTAPIMKVADVQIGTDMKYKPPMMTTTIQH